MTEEEENLLKNARQAVLEAARTSRRAKRAVLWLISFAIVGIGASVALNQAAVDHTKTTTASSIPLSTSVTTLQTVATSTTTNPVTTTTSKPQIGEAQVIQRPPVTAAPITTTTVQQLPAVIVRGVVTCPNADPAKIAQVDAYNGPLSDQQIFKAVGC